MEQSNDLGSRPGSPSPPTSTASTSAAFSPFIPSNSLPPSSLPLPFNLPPIETPVPSIPHYYNTASSPRSRTHSTASSISSFVSSTHSSSYLEANSPDDSACTSHAPCDSGAATLSADPSGHGFLVEEQSVGQVSVHWDQLVQLLVDPRTTASLSAEHPISQASALLASLPSSTLRYGHVPIMLDSRNDNVVPLSAGLEGFSLNSAHFTPGSAPNASQDEEAYDAPQTAHPFRSSFAPFGGPPFPLPSTQSTTLPPAPQSIDPRTFSFTAAHPPFLPSTSALPSGQDSYPTLPIPPARLRRNDSDYHSSYSRKEELRNSSAPYTRPHSFYQQPHISTSSLQDYAGPNVKSSAASFRSLDDGSWSYSAASTEKERARKRARGLRSLNGEEERYAWNAIRAQLVRIRSGVDDDEMTEETGWDEYGEKIIVDMEIIVFTPGTYYKVIEDDVEILPCDSSNRVNTFLRAQHCVSSCQFRFEGKRPSVIRQHVIACKARARSIPGPDPLKRLCELQLGAQHSAGKTRARPPTQYNEGRVTRATAPRLTHWQGVPAAADESDAGDDRSVHSFESVDSGSRLSTRRGRRPVSFAGSFASTHSSPGETMESNQHIEPQQNWWTNKASSNSHDPVQAAILDSSSYQGDGSSSHVAQASAHQDDWLSTYGLKTPTMSTALESQQRAGLASRNSSFLAMEDD